jgi:PLP dependent protein
LFDVVQSVDRLDAGLALAKAGKALGRSLHVLVQVNVSPTERFGAVPAEAPALARRLRDEGLTVDGVMAIGPLEGSVEAAFAQAQSAFAAVGGSTLSLGMSADWERAIHFGSTMIRVGTAIFGPRETREKTNAS